MMFSDDDVWDVPASVETLNKRIFTQIHNRGLSIGQGQKRRTESCNSPAVVSEHAPVQLLSRRGKRKHGDDSPASQSSAVCDTSVEVKQSNSKKKIKKKKKKRSTDSAQNDTSLPARSSPDLLQQQISADSQHASASKKAKRNKAALKMPDRDTAEGCSAQKGKQVQISIPMRTKVQEMVKGSQGNSGCDKDSHKKSESRKRRKLGPNLTDCSKDLETVKYSDANKSADCRLPTPQQLKGMKRFNIDKLRGILQSESHQASNVTSVAVGLPVASSGDKIVPHLPQSATVQQSLKERMQEKLSAARFRYINELMYTSTGSDAAGMFARDRDAYDVYHAGYRSQVAKWPANPVDKMITFVKESGKEAVVGDFGCGEAKISKSVPNVVHSFDLVALDSCVTACDMSHVPLPSSSIDIAVFCLSLMGTNLVDYLCEASRVLRPGGTLLVAEVVSRFDKIGAFIRKLNKLGFTLKNKVTDNPMFVWFEFTKTGPLPPATHRPAVELAPCNYKKR